MEYFGVFFFLCHTWVVEKYNNFIPRNTERNLTYSCSFLSQLMERRNLLLLTTFCLQNLAFQQKLTEGKQSGCVFLSFIIFPM